MFTCSRWEECSSRIGFAKLLPRSSAFKASLRNYEQEIKFAPYLYQHSSVSDSQTLFPTALHNPPSANSNPPSRKDTRKRLKLPEHEQHHTDPDPHVAVAQKTSKTPLDAAADGILDDGLGPEVRV